ncbi:lysophospholipase [Akkermansiaceae bacterium]|nr:lysophospholipase [Akkermansiaceae bacterium]
MIVESQKITLAGHQLHRLILKPEGLSQGSLVFFHGQGDFIDRYPSILEIFVENGITCILTDLPGHGQSSAKRGHVPGFDFVDLLLEDSLENLTGPFGIAGHSMGGMLAIRALLKNPDRFDYAWISSPLLAPARQGSPLMRILLPQIADGNVAPAALEDKSIYFGTIKYQSLKADEVDTLLAEQSDETKAAVADAQAGSGQKALANMAIFPLIMLVVYVLLYFSFKSKGGYKPVEVTS